VVNVLLDIKQEIRNMARGPIDLPEVRIEPANDFTDFIRLEESLKDLDTFNTYVCFLLLESHLNDINICIIIISHFCQTFKWRKKLFCSLRLHMFGTTVKEVLIFFFYMDSNN